MQADTLATVVRLRRLTVENARAALADTLRHQDEAEREAAQAERALHDESARAASTAGGDDLVEAFATWLPEGRKRATVTRAALDSAITRTAQARTVLTLARTALEAVEALSDARQATQRDRAARQDADMLDEAARRVRQP